MRHELRPAPSAEPAEPPRDRGEGRGWNPDEVLASLRQWATELGFSQIGVADVDLSSAEGPLLDWLARGFHGEMHYMASHGLKRARPAELVPGTVRVITARMDYLPQALPEGWQAMSWQRMATPSAAVVSLYAHGRDYHKVLRNRLQKLAERLADAIGPFGFRVFTDSAPVLEVELASRSGLGWRGKHSLLLSRQGGSTFFLGEICVDVPLPLTPPETAHCGHCRACIDACPTGAIVEEGVVDARRCISYLTIELDGPIPEPMRAQMGNRIYGCDDCQLVCPWNKFAQRATLPDFDARIGLDHAQLLQLWAWDEDTFLRSTEGSAIRRIGFARWQRNLAVAMGNVLAGRIGAVHGAGAAEDAGEAVAIQPGIRPEIHSGIHADIRRALQAWLAAPPPELGERTASVAEHVRWALAQQAGAPDTPDMPV